MKLTRKDLRDLLSVDPFLSKCSEARKAFKGATIYFTGGVYDPNNPTPDEDTLLWRSQPCFAVWPELPTSRYVQAFTYWHGIGDINYPGKLGDLFDLGFDNVIRPVFQLLPSSEDLRKQRSFMLPLTEMPLKEINLNYRMIRAYHEHQELLSSCAWLWTHVRNKGYHPAVVLTMAASYRVGPSGFGMQLLKHHGHASLGSPNGMTSLRMLRCLAWAHKHQGHISVGPAYEPASPHDRQYSGYESRYWGPDTTIFPIQIKDLRRVGLPTSPLHRLLNPQAPWSTSLNNLHVVMKRLQKIYTSIQHIEAGDVAVIPNLFPIIKRTPAEQREIQLGARPW